MKLELKDNRDEARNLLWEKFIFLINQKFPDHMRSLEEREDDQSILNGCIAATKLIDSAQKDQIFKKRRLEVLGKIKKSLLIKK